MCKDDLRPVPGSLSSLAIAFLQGRADLDWGPLFHSFPSSGIQRAPISDFTPAQLGLSSRYRTSIALLDISTTQEWDEQAES